MKYGKLTIIEEYARIDGHIYLKCECECGTIKNIREDHLRTGRTLSCGCLKKTILSQKYSGINKFIEYEEYILGIDNHSREFKIDKEDLEKVKKYYWFVSSRGYVKSNIKGTKKQLFLHRYVMGVNVPIDHVNQKKEDNRKSNLRICTKSQNAINKKVNKNNKSGYTGVIYIQRIKKWHSYITVNKKGINLGYYDSLEEAIAARQKAEITYFKDFAREILKDTN